MSISSLFQFIIGFFLGIIFFTAGIGGGAYLFLTKVNVNPEKHLFSEEKPSPEKTKPANVEKTEKTTTETSKVEKVEVKPSPKDKLPKGAYRAKVTWSSGLSLRAEPSKDAPRVGGIGYNWELIILSTSDDKRWQKVRIPSSGQEGWVKAGNVAKVSEED